MQVVLSPRLPCPLEPRFWLGSVPRQGGRRNKPDVLELGLGATAWRVLEPRDLARRA